MEVLNKPVPLSAFVIKIASRCNLDCSYCYEYNMGDDSWKHMPKFMALSTFKRILDRIREHANAHDFSNVSISLHGGEPLLAGHDRFEEYLVAIQEHLAGMWVTAGLQTNAVLLDETFLRIFKKYNVSVGVSLDGMPADNDRFRYYHNRKGSGKDVEAKLALLSGSALFGGILSVINLDADPVQTWRYLAGFNPPVLDFLLPHAHWENSRTPQQMERINKHGEWMSAIFDDWFDGYRSDVRIRFFEEIMYRLFGHKGSLESLGLEEVGLVTIGVNGYYEQVDTMKSVFPGAHTTPLQVETDSLDKVLEHQGIRSRQLGLAGLSEKCQTCDLVGICGGGYYPHRYSHENQYRNPSVYCHALMHLIRHIRKRIESKISKPVS